MRLMQGHLQSDLVGHVRGLQVRGQGMRLMAEFSPRLASRQCTGMLLFYRQ